MSDEYGQRISKLEGRVSAIEISSAREEGHRVSVERRLDSIEGTLSKLVWLMVSSIVGAAMVWIISGGLMIG